MTRTVAHSLLVMCVDVVLLLVLHYTALGFPPTKQVAYRIQ